MCVCVCVFKYSAVYTRVLDIISYRIYRSSKTRIKATYFYKNSGFRCNNQNSTL